MVVFVFIVSETADHPRPSICMSPETGFWIWSATIFLIDPPRALDSAGSGCAEGGPPEVIERRNDLPELRNDLPERDHDRVELSDDLAERDRDQNELSDDLPERDHDRNELSDDLPERVHDRNALRDDLSWVRRGVRARARVARGVRDLVRRLRPCAILSSFGPESRGGSHGEATQWSRRPRRP